MKNIQRAFTLIEILLVTAIVPVIGLAVYSVLNNGIKLWERISPALPQEDINIFFEKIANDLRNSFQYTGLEFSGSEEKISFPTLITFQGEKEVGQVTYFFDRSAHTLNREQANYGQIYQKRFSPSQLAKRIKTLNFQYYSYNPRLEVYRWKPVWQNEENLPWAIRIKIEFHQDNEVNQFTRTISIPVAEK